MTRGSIRLGSTRVASVGVLVFVASTMVALSACSSSDPAPNGSTDESGAPTGTSPTSTATTPGGPPTVIDDGPPAGNPDGKCEIPAEARAEDVSKPTTVIGNGTKESCTGDAVVEAVAKGGVVTFNCGKDPVTIVLDRTAKVFNDRPDLVLDGGGKVTLSGGKKVRILYQNTCDEKQKYTTSHCQDQESPHLTVQNITFVDGATRGEEPEGGGAIFARGGRLKIVSSRFFANTCDETGPDVGGGAVRAFDQAGKKPLYVVGSTFGGKAGLGNVGSNGGALSSIGVSYTVLNSLFTHNKAIGNGANPAKAGTPGGGSGGAIYNDGNTFTLTLCGDRIEDNHANEGGGAIFFVSNDRSGTLSITDSVLRRNPSDGFESQDTPGIFYIAKDKPTIVRSTLE